MSWTHIGRLWTNGDPYLAIDADGRRNWHGADDHVYEQQIVALTADQTSIPVGSATAAVLGDGVVRDDSWMEVLTADDGRIAIVQADGPDYHAAVTAALDYPVETGEAGADLDIPSGRIALFSSACDGVGEYAMELIAPRPGPIPAEHGRPSPDLATGLLLPVSSPRYHLWSRSYTELGEDTCFARWLLTPTTLS